MSILTDTDVERRKGYFQRQLDSNFVPMDEDRIKLVAERLVNTLRRNYRLGMMTPESSEMLGGIDFFITDGDLVDLVAEKHAALHAAIVEYIEDEDRESDGEGFELTTTPQRVMFQDDDGKEQLGYYIRATIYYRRPRKLNVLVLKTA